VPVIVSRQAVDWCFSHLKQNAKDIGDHHSKWDTVENKQLLSNICNQPVDDGAFSKIQQYQ
jgi:hypothetical protein